MADSALFPVLVVHIKEAIRGRRKSFLLRIDPGVLKAVQRWADDDLRSLNAQIEFLLRKSLASAGRAEPKEKPDDVIKGPGPQGKTE